MNQGKSSVWAQGSVLGLYDPDRLKDPVFTASSQPEQPRSWEDFQLWLADHMRRFKSSRGEGLAFLVDKKGSPSLEAMRQTVLQKYPSAKWYTYSPAEFEEQRRGLKEAFGRDVAEVLHLDKADVVVSLDRDFLSHTEPGHVKHMREFASRRRVLDHGDVMNRLYAIESGFTGTGAKADHRIGMAPSLIPTAAAALARALVARGVGGEKLSAIASRNVAATGVPAGWIEAMADDLAAHRGASLVVAGATQPLAVHVLAAAINEALGNIGTTVTYRALTEIEAASSADAITDLARQLDAGAIDTLVTLNANPVYDAPGDLDFGKKLERAKTRITLSVDRNETVAASTWQLPGAHFLESWGDTRALDGTISPIQPMIAPLYNGRSDIEVLAMIAGQEQTDGYHIVRGVWSDLVGAGAEFEKKWRRALHDGVLAGSGAKPESGGVRTGSLAGFEAGRGPSESNLDLVFTLGMVGDGRFANYGWLQELPDPLTKIVWDNVAVMSEATAKKFAVHQDRESDKHRGARFIDVKVAGLTMRLPAWVAPGLPDWTVLVHLGYGREVCGVVGQGVGFNAYKALPSGGRALARGVQIERSATGPAKHNISTTQQHGTMEGRAILRSVDFQRWQKQAFDASGAPLLVHKADHYGNESKIHFAETLDGSMYAHAPENWNLYVNPQRGSHKPPPAAEAGTDFSKSPQWGMTIDLASCSSCNACTIACQAENNIPIVGKAEVNHGREMHWIRVDRYFTGDPAGGAEGAVGMAFQPVACVHCENAPCETVCPVNATVHGPEGINYMVYNRCIGTRYCANNCPYKVRRFNFFDFGVKKFNGDYLPTYSEDENGKITHGFAGKETFGDINEHMIPPRLREKLDEITKMRMNPDVTVRSRGVMEKCSYCIQRINEARIEVKLKGLEKIPDGFFQPACAQACPADAIVFGDILDDSSRVKRMRENGRSYMLLGFLNTRPRTTHLVEMKNPNQALVSAERIAEWEQPFVTHEGGGHEGHGGGEGDGAGHEGGGDAHASRRGFFRDPASATVDKGYRMSLNVLGGIG
jgi:molybdopterin-containing oxidoreductase family iron-sulfur binding subunit